MIRVSKCVELLQDICRSVISRQGSLLLKQITRSKFDLAVSCVVLLEISSEVRTSAATVEWKSGRVAASCEFEWISMSGCLELTGCRVLGIWCF